MSKRRRTSSVASRGADGDDSDDFMESNNPVPTQSSRKRKKLDPGEICQQLYDTIRSYKKEDGTLLCDSFKRAPKRRQEPQYYEVVSQPIDLLRVQQKLKTDTYEDIEELSADIELMVNNAKAFYKPDTVEYKDASDLWKLYIQTKQSLDIGEDMKTPKLSRTGSSSRRSDIMEELSETSTNYDEDNVYEELFNAVMTANTDNRPLYIAFQFLPSKRRYPEYYNVIDSPIDLKTIAQKIQGGEYSNLNELEKDLLLMVRNACHFNEPGSQIYKDAKTLKKVIQARKQEIDQHGRTPCKTSERIRSKRTSRIGPVPTSATLAIMEAPGAGAGAELDSEIKTEIKHSEDSDKGEDSDVEDKEFNENSPQWKLLNAIRTHLGPNGSPMADPFCKLPSRRFYPDYYKAIKNPVSLNQIRNKIRRGSYGTLSEVAGDMNIMFENAKVYNVPTSKLYKEAVKLQRLMQQRVQELLDIVPSSSSDDESLSSVKSQAQVPTPRPRGRPRANPLPPTTMTPVISSVVSLAKVSLPLKKKLHIVSKHLVEFTCSDGRQPMLLFMEKPSKKLYPEYYNVIDKPIDMLMIETNIKNERYSSLEEMVNDFRLMFSNCRQFNEEGSMIYEDANLLEKVMNDKLKELSSSERKTPVKTIKATKSRQMAPSDQKLRPLYDAIRDYRDPKANRQLALIFMKLPSKNDYPDYYELIKNPIDMEKIAQKLKNGMYTSVNELASDFILMFDNACKYNEPDSQIYKDALTLQRVCLQTKQMLREDDDAIPDVSAAVQELLLNLFTMVYNHQDEEGRCYSDSMAELPEHDESPNGEKVRAISLDLVKRRLDRGLYKRLDYFQQDMFAVFERARRLSRTDSQVFEDSVELQTYYIEQRDALCKNTLESPALDFTREMMVTSIELVKQCKLLQENSEEEETRSSNDDSMPPGGGAPLPQTRYNKGDFVYLQPAKGKRETCIVQVERVWTNSEGVPMLYANVYFRPHETFHVRTRKFLEQEVFKSDTQRTAPLDHIIGHCYVMNVKEYFKYKPEAYADKDVYVCESRYSTRYRNFKKIKVWESAEREVTLVPREVPLEPSRTVSVFRERVEKHKDELAELELLENILEKPKLDIVMYNPLGTDDENTYYEQYNTVCSGVIKRGDYVYVVTDGGKQMIAQVDTIWETGDNKGYFSGPFLIFPSEVASVINKPFFKQEVLLTTMRDTSPLVGIIGKCAVLDYDDYLKSRPTEIAEADVYLCESQYDESSRIARKLKAGLSKFEHSKDVSVDEIYYFSKPLGPPALASAQEVQSTSVAFSHKPYNPTVSMDSLDVKPQFTNLINTTLGSQDVEMILENSLDDSSLASPATPLSIGGNSNSYNPSMTSSTSQDRFSQGQGQGQGQTVTAPPSTGKKKKESKQKLVTGYILYSSEVRKAISANNPEATFGEISRIVGNEWRSLATSTKQSWEERAARCNEETSARLAEEMKEIAQHTPMEMTYECAWDNCDYQFEDLADCMEHCIGEGGNLIGTYIETKKPKLEPGHIQQHYRSSPSEFPCLWRSCARVRKGQAPFPNLPRVLRHVRDLHINKGNGRIMAIHERSRNFVPSSKRPPKAYTNTFRSGIMSPGASMSPLARKTPSPGQVMGDGGAHAGAGSAGGSVTSRHGLEPLFASAPPRVQRVTHSEAYIRYIEGLHSEQKYITPWEKSLTPMPSNPDPNNFSMHKLPGNWLTEEAVNGYLMQDKTLTDLDLQKMDPSTKILKGLCALRDFMMKDALNIYKNL